MVRAISDWQVTVGGVVSTEEKRWEVECVNVIEIDTRQDKEYEHEQTVCQELHSDKDVVVSTRGETMKSKLCKDIELWSS